MACYDFCMTHPDRGTYRRREMAGTAYGPQDSSEAHQEFPRVDPLNRPIFRRDQITSVEELRSEMVVARVWTNGGVEIYKVLDPTPQTDHSGCPYIIILF